MSAVNPMSGVIPPDGAPHQAPSILYPSWMDGRYALAVSKVLQPVHIIMPNEGITIIPANANRYLLVVCAINGMGGFQMSPWATPSLIPWFVPVPQAAGTVVSLFAHGVAVCGEWYISGMPNTELSYQETIVF